MLWEKVLIHKANTKTLGPFATNLFTHSVLTTMRTRNMELTCFSEIERDSEPGNFTCTKIKLEMKQTILDMIDQTALNPRGSCLLLLLKSCWRPKKLQLLFDSCRFVSSEQNSEKICQEVKKNRGKLVVMTHKVITDSCEMSEILVAVLSLFVNAHT